MEQKQNVLKMTLNGTGAALCGAAVHVQHQLWRQCRVQGRISSSSGQIPRLFNFVGCFCFVGFGLVVFLW